MTFKAVLLFVSVLLSIPSPSVLLAAEWCVDGSVSASGDGTSWETALKTIQEGIDKALDGHIVRVADGVYVENIEYKGKNITLTSTDPLDRSVVAGTIIDGNQAGSVVTFSGTESEACILSGFTIRNGKSSEALAVGGGVLGGTYSQGTQATIQNNTITGNSVTGGQSHGGGLAFCDGTVQGNIITGNSADLGAGLSNCNGAIRDNTITGNSAGSGGGGLSGCNGTIQRNTIIDNSAAGAHGGGGGLHACNGTIQHNVIAHNAATPYGGGLYSCDGTIRNNTITGNSARLGGGLFGCHGTVRNNAILGNSAGASGGGLHYCSGPIQNNTITGNSAGASGGGLYYCRDTIQNCIVWGNPASVGAQLYESSLPRFSCIQDWSEGGEGNIAGDPAFADPDGLDNNPDTHSDNDYRLSWDSPCIDAGSNENWMWQAVDLDGNPRVFYGVASVTVDMGAYEYNSFHLRVLEVAGQDDGVRITWTSRPGDTFEVWSPLDDAFSAWEQQGTLMSEGTTLSWSDPAPGATVKFYRIQLVP